MIRILCATLVFVFILSGCLSTPVYDESTVKNMVEMKKIYQTDVELAKKGSLTDDIKTSALEFFDSAIYRERAKQ